MHRLMLFLLLTAAETEEEYINITPTLLRFAVKFFIVFAVIAIVGILTPHMAKKVDAMRAKHAKQQYQGDPRCAAVKSPYDIAPPESADDTSEASDVPEEDETAAEENKPGGMA